MDNKVTLVKKKKTLEVARSLEAGLREAVVDLRPYTILRGAGLRLDLDSEQARADREKWDIFSETNIQKETARVRRSLERGATGPLLCGAV